TGRAGAPQGVVLPVISIYAKLTDQTDRAARAFGSSCQRRVGWLSGLGSRLQTCTCPALSKSGRALVRFETCRKRLILLGEREQLSAYVLDRLGFGQAAELVSFALVMDRPFLGGL